MSETRVQESYLHRTCDLPDFKVHALATVDAAVGCRLPLSEKPQFRTEQFDAAGLFMNAVVKVGVALYRGI